jgi:hypothetical protein
MTMEERIVNLQKKSLKEFTPEDTLYIRKMERGYSFHYLCQFVALKKGVVHAKVIKVLDRPWMREFDIPKTLTAKPSSCYLWGKDPSDDRWERCYWYKKDQWS